jgi:hypothetical protein
MWNDFISIGLLILNTHRSNNQRPKKREEKKNAFFRQLMRQYYLSMHDFQGYHLSKQFKIIRINQINYLI